MVEKWLESCSSSTENRIFNEIFFKKRRSKMNNISSLPLNASVGRS